MTRDDFSHSADQISDQASRLAADIHALALNAQELAAQAVATHEGGVSYVVTGLTVFVLACFVGYHVVWRVTPALHSPLMGVTNAISSVIIVGALIAAGPAGFGFSKVAGFFAVVFASVNIFGGFIVTQRMLSMFRAKK